MAEVWERLLEGLKLVDESAGGEHTCVVVVGHGDPLQILQAGNCGEEEMKKFTEITMANAEARLMNAGLPPDLIST